MRWRLSPNAKDELLNLLAFLAFFLIGVPLLLLAALDLIGLLVGF